jgi:uncharacterized membrane protein YkvA (DUF1232 family)
MEALKAAAQRLKREVLTLYCLAKNPNTPLLARVLALLVAGYALSPIDLIPDFIPVLGVLDDLILVPLGVWLVLKLVPATHLEVAREQAAHLEGKPVSWGGLAFMVCVWLLAAWWLVQLFI